MTDTKREGPDRRRTERGGRRDSDLRALTPALQAEAAGYASEIAQGLGILIAALEDADIVAAGEASKTIKKAADALRLLLATGKSMRHGT
jgi:hypothetical protein